MKGFTKLFEVTLENPVNYGCEGPDVNANNLVMVNTSNTTKNPVSITMHFTILELRSLFNITISLLY